jgi:hypothetical protein
VGEQSVSLDGGFGRVEAGGQLLAVGTHEIQSFCAHGYSRYFSLIVTKWLRRVNDPPYSPGKPGPESGTTRRADH